LRLQSIDNNDNDTNNNNNNSISSPVRANLVSYLFCKLHLFSLLKHPMMNYKTFYEEYSDESRYSFAWWLKSLFDINISHDNQRLSANIGYSADFPSYAPKPKESRILIWISIAGQLKKQKKFRWRKINMEFNEAVLKKDPKCPVCN
jgi:hypothetical protein